MRNKHKAVLIRVRNAIEENREFRPNTNIYVFKKHTQSCQVWDNTPNIPGRKRKHTSKAGPSRGKLNTENVTQGDENENNALQNVIDAFRELKTDSEFDEFFKTVTNELPEERLILISSLIGTRVNNAVKKAASNLKSKYKQTEFLSSYNTYQTYQSVIDSNPNLVSYLKAVRGVVYQPNKRQVYLLSRVIEGIYKLTYGNIVYPLAFLNNLQTYVETGSRQIIDLNGAATGGGQSDMISNWLTNLASLPVYAPDGDVGHAFDNNQKVGKTWHVAVDGKVKSSVITMHIWLSLDKTGHLQENKNLKPAQRYENKSLMKMIRDAEDPLFLELNKELYNSLYHVIETNIKSVVAKQRNTNGKVTDFIDNKIEKESCLVCTVCEKDGLSIPYPKTKQKCDICHTQLTKTVKNSTTQIQKVSVYCVILNSDTKKLQKKITEESNGRYEQIQSNHPTQTQEVTVGEPTFVNPNSYQTCTEVLRKFGSEAGIERCGGKKWQWVIIECDGLPFRLFQHHKRCVHLLNMQHVSFQKGRFCET